MAVRLKITIDETPLISALDRIEKGMVDTTPLMDAIGAVLVEGTQRRFETGTTPRGRKWKQSLRAKERGGITLVDTGRLLSSITHAADKDEVRVGTNVRYGRIHQTGGEIRPKNAKALTFRLANGQVVSVGKVTIPPRPYLGVDQEDRAGIEEQVRFFLEDLVK